MRRTWVSWIFVLSLVGCGTVPDLPDDYPFLPESSRSPLADLGEVAARLGSIVTYDRRGEVVWLDAFGNGLSPWVSSAVGTGASVSVVATNTDVGGYAAKLVGGSTGSGSVTLGRYVSVESLGRMGIEFSFYVPTAFNVVYVSLYYFDGTTLHRATVRLTWTGGVWAYLDQNGVYQDIASPGVFAGTPNIYNRVKLVADFVEDEYVRLLFDDQEYDLTGKGLRLTASGFQATQVGIFDLIPRAGQNDWMQVGRCIITGNEP